ncbi:MAG: tetratricopeptide repeat protein, partial [Kiritimatiellia bacterium]|nr:tetratricopeptide repeat protein [Kiritimatiellia bacterium]
MRNRINRRVLTPVFCLLCGWVLSQETPDLRSRPVSEETKLWNAALEDIGTGRDAHAVPKLEQILMLNPRNYTAWEHLGWCYLRLQREQDTERLWNRLRQIDPTHPAAYKFLAKLAIQQNRLKEAQDLFRKSLDRDPDQPDVVYNLGRSLRWEGQMQRSVDILEPLLKENPDRTDVILELARAKMSQWDFAGALSHWTTLSFLAPPQLDYRANRALCLLHTGNLEEALLLAGEVLALDPLHLIALQTLANAAEMGENPAQALPYLERWMDAQVEEKEKEAVRVRLIRLHVRLYRDQPKIRTLTRAIELSRDRLRWNPN